MPEDMRVDYMSVVPWIINDSNFPTVEQWERLGGHSYVYALRDIPKERESWYLVCDNHGSKNSMELAYAEELDSNASTIEGELWARDQEGSEWADYDGYIVMSPDAPYADEIRKLCERLEDYPLLDEDDYSRREWEHWEELAPDALLDELEKLRKDDIITDELHDALTDQLDTILDIATQLLHWQDGWEGTYSPTMVECLVSQVSDTGYIMSESKEPAIHALLQQLAKAIEQNKLQTLRDNQ